MPPLCALVRPDSSALAEESQLLRPEGKISRPSELLRLRPVFQPFALDCSRAAKLMFRGAARGRSLSPTDLFPMSESYPKVDAASPPDFRERAIREAQRYGADPWIFVRELMQNARDAGATRVDFVFKESDSQSQLHCIDDGEGMAWEHAKRYLFSLYTSSKEGSDNKAGRFGVGFWAILRFAPAQIIIRSKARGAHISKAWGLALEGDLRQAKKITPATQSGTEIVLNRPRAGNSDAQSLLDAVRAHGRFLTQRDDHERRLELRVNGVCVNEAFALPAPSLRFSAPGVRGVVGLARVGQVELFSRGLRIRSAPTLNDLVSSRPASSNLPVGANIAPRILLDCDHVQVLLHRSDVREDAVLRRALTLTRRHLRRLVEAQLSGIRRPSWSEAWLRCLQWFQERPANLRWSMVASLLALCSIGIWMSLLPEPTIHRAIVLGANRQNYQGATVQSLGSPKPSSLDFRYHPPQQELHFRQFSVSQLELGRPVAAPTLFRYQGTSCDQDPSCVDIDLRIQSPQASSTNLRFGLAEASGFRIDPQSIEYLPNDPSKLPKLKLLQDTQGDPWLVSTIPLDGRLHYRVGPAPSPPDKRATSAVDDPAFKRWHPQEPMEVAQAIRRVAAAVRYSTDEASAQSHQAAIERGESVFARGLGLGTGDCDVQNSILAALLRTQGYQARLAVGYVGRHGFVSPTLHAWVEYRRDNDDLWSIADSSRPSASDGPLLFAQGPPPPPPSDLHEKFSKTVPLSRNSARFLGRWWWVGGGLSLMGLSLVFVRLQRPPRDSVDESKAQLCELMLGALEQPASFSGIPGVFLRKVVTRLHGPPMSLNEVKKSRRYARLWVSQRTHAMALRAIASGADLLDGCCPVARAVADHVQAGELDRWQRVWEARHPPHAAITRVHRALDELRLSLKIAVSDAIRDEPELLNLGPTPVAPKLFSPEKLEVYAECLVFYSPRHPLIRALNERQPTLASFALARDAVERVTMDEGVRARVLGYLARQSFPRKVAS